MYHSKKTTCVCVRVRREQEWLEERTREKEEKYKNRITEKESERKNREKTKATDRVISSLLSIFASK